jgi:tape measure domain-containing protein
MDNSFKPQVDQARADIRSIVDEFKLLDNKAIETSKIIREKFSGILNIKSSNALNEMVSDLNVKMEILIETIEKQTAQYGKLATKKKEVQKYSEQEKSDLKAVKKEYELEYKAKSKVISQYDKLIAQRKKMRNELDKLIVTKGKDHKATKRMQAAYDKVSKSTSRANKGFLLLSKGGIKGAITGITNLASAFGVVGGLTLFANIVTDVFALTKQLESLSFALKAVTESQGEYAQVQEFLADISDKYGASLLTTTERYTKFLAAAKQSNVSLSDTEQIFESVTKASGVLGLKTDELTGVYLALEQMLSKGKVTTEELRRQLGERLPGAFGIMADALGVTVAQLDKMLRKGEILSSEALPRFAKQLEKAYGIEQVTRIDTLVAAQNRLSNKWIEFVNVLTDGDTIIKSTFSGVLNFLSAVLDGITGLAEKIREAFTSDEAKAALKEQEQFGKKQQEQIDSLNTIVSIRERYNKALQQSFDLQSNLSGRIASDGSFSKQQADETAEALVRLAGKTKNYSEFLEKSTQIIERNDLVSKSYLASIYARLKGTQSVIDATSKQIAKQNDEGEAVDELEKSYKNLLRIKEKVLELDAKGGSQEELEKEKDRVAAEIARMQQILQGTPILNSGSQGSNSESNSGSSELGFGIGAIQTPSVDAMNDALTKSVENLKELEKQGEITAEELKDVFGSTMDTFSELFDFDMSKLDFVFEQITGQVFTQQELLGNYADLAKETINSVLDATLNKYDLELQAAQRSQDLILENDLATAKQKRIAREKFDREERRIQNERAKAERRNNLIKIAVDTSVGVVKALASSPPPANFVLAGIVGALGLAQAAIVASQPLPKFAEGHLAGTHSGKALINDAKRSNYQEVVERGNGQVEVYKDRNQVIDMKRGDKVHKSTDSFLTYHDINKDILRMSVQGQMEQLKMAEKRDMLTGKIDEMKKEFSQTTESMMALAKRPIHNHNHITIEKPYNYNT